MRQLLFSILCSGLWISCAKMAFGWQGKAHTACDAAAQHASVQSGVPLSVLKSIARVETGKKINGNVGPWPWTVNVLGKGYFFETKSDALTFSTHHLDSGNVNFDVGCFQVNLRWHSKGFASLADAFDPMSNAAYAARFLEKLYLETGSWSDAIAAFHSRSPEHAEPYLAKVKAAWQNLQNAPPDQDRMEDSALQERLNTYPLLQAGLGMNGSLVPQSLETGVKFGLR